MSPIQTIEYFDIITTPALVGAILLGHIWSDYVVKLPDRNTRKLNFANYVSVFLNCQLCANVVRFKMKTCCLWYWHCECIYFRYLFVNMVAPAKSIGSGATMVFTRWCKQIRIISSLGGGRHAINFHSFQFYIRLWKWETASKSILYMPRKKIRPLFIRKVAPECLLCSDNIFGSKRPENPAMW